MNDFNQTEKNPRFFYSTADFSFLKPLVDNFKLIREEFIELDRTRGEDTWMIPFPEYVKADKKNAWKVFSFNLFCMRFPKNATACPNTSELIFSMPEIISSNYSFMKPGTHILPHKGYSRMQLRCHLPLVVPDEKLCAIRVGNETKHWREGELMIFDDSFEHETWNKSGKDRIVLMFDIPNPLWGYTAHQIAKYKIENLDDAFLLGMAPKEKWIKAFNKGVFPL